MAAATGDDKHRLTALEGLAALSLDALSSVAYGPEAIVIVLVAAGTAGLAYTLPVTVAIVLLLAVLVASYRQVIAARTIRHSSTRYLNRLGNADVIASTPADTPTAALRM